MLRRQIRLVLPLFVVMCAFMGVQAATASANDISWVGAGDGMSWSDADNWYDEDTSTPGVAPGASDVVFIDGGFTVNVDTGVTAEAASLNLRSGDTLQLRGGNLVTSGLITGDPDLSSRINWTDSTSTIDSATNVLSITDVNLHMTNGGTPTWPANLDVTFTGGSSIRFDDDTNMDGGLGSNLTLDPGVLMTKVVTAGVSSVTIPIIANDSSVIDAASGTLSIDGGGTLKGEMKGSATGNLRFGHGTFMVNGATVSGKGVTLADTGTGPGTFMVGTAKTITLSSALTIDGGVLDGDGQMLGATPVINWKSNSDGLGSTGTLHLPVGATINQRAALAGGNLSRDVDMAGTWNIDGDSNSLLADGPYTITMDTGAKIVRKAGTDVTEVSADVIVGADASVEAQAGGLKLTGGGVIGGTLSATAPSTLALSGGTFFANDGTIVGDGVSVASTATFDITGTKLHLASNAGLDFAGTLVGGGQVYGAGTVAFHPASVSAGLLTIGDGTGATRVNVTDSVTAAARTITVADHATLGIDDAVNFVTGTIGVTGTLTKNAGPGAAKVTGPVTVAAAGTLSVNDGTFTIGSGGTSSLTNYDNTTGTVAVGNYYATGTGHLQIIDNGENLINVDGATVGIGATAHIERLDGSNPLEALKDIGGTVSVSNNDVTFASPTTIYAGGSYTQAGGTLHGDATPGSTLQVDGRLDDDGGSTMDLAATDITVSSTGTANVGDGSAHTLTNDGATTIVGDFAVGSGAGTAVTNTKTLTVNGTHTLTLTGNYSQTGASASTVENGILDATGHLVTIDGGTLAGTGTIITDLLGLGTTAATDVHPGASTASTAYGTLHVTGAVNVDANAFVHAGIGLGGHDTLSATGNIDFVAGGKLAAETSAAFDAAPVYDESPPLVHGSSVTGGYALQPLGTPAGDAQYRVIDSPPGGGTVTDVVFDVYETVAPTLTDSVAATDAHTTTGPSNDSSIDVAWTAADDGAGSGVNGYSISVDTDVNGAPDDTFDQAGITYTANIVADGSYYVHVKAIDNEGNVSTPVRTAGPFEIDTLAPSLLITNSPAATTTSTSAFFVLSSEATATFACSIDGAAAVSCTSLPHYDGLAAGRSHTFSVTATDVAGNPSAVASYTWIIYGPPAKPKSLAMKFGKKGSATLSWKKPAVTAATPITKYIVVYKGKTFNVTGTSLKVKGQKKGKKYTFTVKASGPGGTSAAAKLTKKRTRA